MSVDSNKTALSKVLDWIVPIAKHHKRGLGAYTTLILALWACLFAFPKALDDFLPPAKGDHDWKRNWLAVGIGLGVPTLVILLAEGLPTLLQRRRDQKLIDWGVRGPAEYGYFRLMPYERKDRDQFRREDGRDREVQAWVRESATTVLYLTGRSGVGKSSLLSASVLPGLESAEPTWMTVIVRTFDNAAAILAATLRKPGPVYEQPPKDLPGEILPLLRRIDEYLKERKKRLLVALDQFEEFLIAHDLDAGRQAPMCELLVELERKPLERIRLLLSMRADYVVDVARIGLPRLHQDRNWMEVDAFSEPAARDFLRDGFKGDGIGEKLIEAVVRHASDLDDVRGKVRPIVPNMLGQALAARAAQANRVLSPRDAESLIFDHVRDGLNDPLSRDHAPKILPKLVKAHGNKDRPATVADLAGRTGLEEPLVQGCLTRLKQLGFVRPVDADRVGPVGSQIWEVSHDFIARLLSLVLPALRPSLPSRLRRALGPMLLFACIVTILGLFEYQQSRVRASQDVAYQVNVWASKYNATTKRLSGGKFAVLSPNNTGQVEFNNALRENISAFCDKIENFQLTNSNEITALPPDFARLTALTTLDLRGNELKNLPPEMRSIAIY